MTHEQASNALDDYVSREMNKARPRYREASRGGYATRAMRSAANVARAMRLTRKLRKGKRK